MDRAKLALQIIAIDVRNAKARQRKRLQRQDLYSLAIDKGLREVSEALRAMRTSIARVSRLEDKERLVRGDSKKIRSSVGQNTRLSGTLGKR